MLYLYKASYLLVEGESTLEEAREFTTKNLIQILNREDIDQYLAMLASRSVELPLHWRVSRLEVRSFIDVYERRADMNPTLLQFAKLDYNMVQATHQADLKLTLRGDNPKSIQCYIHETDASEEEARDHIKYLIGETWKKMNKDRGAESPCSKTLVKLAMNLGRMAQCMYQYGDGHVAEDVETKDRVLSLLINPIPL
ncbi:hypothetical protein Vadar_026664 [Vaccinium darrowii]|uniref:Uncharacterized protein n=1 Tax=Vaccinium darrowii TaxID=229202 RepID=A0ACB7YQX8_9ERIC|nr:hypothetical protein Vadar_026664 [Vaccinium darrowii]